MEVNKEYSFTFSANIISGVTNATGKTMPVTLTVKVTRKQQYSYRTYCTMSVTNSTITAFDTSGTTSYTFTAKIQRSKDNWTTVENVSNDSMVKINQSSATLTPTTMGSSATTTSDTTFKFILSGGTYTIAGTTSIVGHVYKYGETYYNG